MADLSGFGPVLGRGGDSVLAVVHRYFGKWMARARRQLALGHLTIYLSARHPLISISMLQTRGLIIICRTACRCLMAGSNLKSCIKTSTYLTGLGYLDCRLSLGIVDKLLAVSQPIGYRRMTGG